MKVEVISPREDQAAVTNMMLKRHGLLAGTEETANWCTIIAEVSVVSVSGCVYEECGLIPFRSKCAQIPLNDMFGFVGDLRSQTQGKGEYTMEYARYAPTLPHVQRQLAQEYDELLLKENKNKFRVSIMYSPNVSFGSSSSPPSPLTRVVRRFRLVLKCRKLLLLLEGWFALHGGYGLLGR